MEGKKSVSGKPARAGLKPGARCESPAAHHGSYFGQVSISVVIDRLGRLRKTIRECFGNSKIFQC